MAEGHYSVPTETQPYVSAGSFRQNTRREIFTRRFCSERERRRKRRREKDMCSRRRRRQSDLLSAKTSRGRRNFPLSDADSYVSVISGPVFRRLNTLREIKEPADRLSRRSRLSELISTFCDKRASSRNEVVYQTRLRSILSPFLAQVSCNLVFMLQ